MISTIFWTYICDKEGYEQKVFKDKECTKLNTDAPLGGDYKFKFGECKSMGNNKNWVVVKREEAE